jgi:hypothetical protein
MLGRVSLTRERSAGKCEFERTFGMASVCGSLQTKPFAVAAAVMGGE